MLFFILLLIVATLIFIQSNNELWNEVGKDVCDDIKESINKWYKGTSLFMWINNRKNKVEILSEKKYVRLLKEGKIKNIIIEKEV